MKLKVLIAALFVAGFASSFALAGGTRAAVDTTTGTTTGTTSNGTTTGTTTTTHTTTGTTTTETTHTTPDKPKCHKVELQGSNGTGSVSFTVDHASKSAKALGGTAVTLAIAGARVHATACVDAAGALTLSHLELSMAKKHDDAQKQDEHEKKKDEHGK